MTYRNIVGMQSANDGDDDADDAAEHKHRRPPDVIRERIIPARAQMSEDAGDKGNDPGELSASISIPTPPRPSTEQQTRTMAMEMVASANGSPNRLPRLMRPLPPRRRPRRPVSIGPPIFWSEGECEDG